MGGDEDKDVSIISAAIQDKDKISTATPPISETAILMELPMKLLDATGNGTSKMAASKLEFAYLYLSFYTRQQRNSNGNTYFFGVQQSHGGSGSFVRPRGKKPEEGNPRWWPRNLKYDYLSFHYY